MQHRNKTDVSKNPLSAVWNIVGESWIVGFKYDFFAIASKPKGQHKTHSTHWNRGRANNVNFTQGFESGLPWFIVASDRRRIRSKTSEKSAEQRSALRLHHSQRGQKRREQKSFRSFRNSNTKSEYNFGKNRVLSLQQPRYRIKARSCVLFSSLPLLSNVSPYLPSADRPRPSVRPLSGHLQ